MLFVCPRDTIVGGTLGYFIRFKKDVPTFVPDEMKDAVIEAGAVLVAEIDEIEISTSSRPSEEEVKKALYAAFDEMMSRGRKGDFTAAGVPDLRVLSGMVKIPVTTDQRDRYWMEYNSAEKVL